MIKDGHIIGSTINPVSLLWRYMAILCEILGGPLTFLLLQFVSSVQPNRTRKLGFKPGLQFQYDHAHHELIKVRHDPVLAKYKLTDSKFGLHSLRARACTTMFERGVAPHLIQKQARHARFQLGVRRK